MEEERYVPRRRAWSDEPAPADEPSAAHASARIPLGPSLGVSPKAHRLGWLVDGPGWSWFAFAVDAGGVLAGFAAGLLEGWSHRDTAGVWSLLALPVVGAPALTLARRRSRRLDAGMIDDLTPLLQGLSVAAMLAALCGTLAGSRMLDMGVIVTSWGTALAVLGCSHSAVRLARRRLRVRGIGGRPTLIVGAGVIGARFGRRLAAHPEYGMRPVGFLDWAPMPAGAVGGRPAPVLGKPSDVHGAIRATGARQVVLAFPARPDRKLLPLLRSCHDLGVDVAVIPRLFEHTNDHMTYEPVGGLPLLGLSADRGRARRIALKHATDRVIAAVLLVLLAPLLVAIAVAVRLTTGGQVTFRQRRLGRDGREFELWKFCSMRAASGTQPVVVDLHSDLGPGGVEGDDRRTAVGRFLRRTSFDELLQLVNVVRGEMSLVGPRPERPELVELYSDTFERYADRLRMRPGISGLAQVKGLRGRTSLSERVELDNYYIEHWSFALDCKILLRTCNAAFRVPE